MAETDLLRRQLTRHEGRPMQDGRAYAYRDSRGFWTIGTGRLIDRRRGGGLSDAECDLLLDNDMAETLADVMLHLPWVAGLDDVRQRVILDMAFNLGCKRADGGIGPKSGAPGLLGFAATLEAVRTGDYSRAARNMLASLWARQVGARAPDLALMMQTGADPLWLRPVAG